MARFMVIHTVEDYAKWKPVFDADSVNRKAMGGREGLLFRDADKPNQIVILWEWESLKKAREFAQSPKLREAMQEAGVVGMPTILFLDEVEKVKV